VARVAPGGSGVSKGADGRPVELALVPDDMVLRNVVSAVADGIVVVDPAGVVIFANPAAEDLFGRPLEELIYAEFGFPLGAGETTEIELLVPGGMSRVVEMRVTETTWEDKRVNVAALRDVGPRRQTERALEAAVEQRDVVLAAASHEMRSPLAVITGMTEILHDSWADLSEDKKLDLVDLIGKQARHLSRVVRKLLTLSRIEAGVLGIVPEAFDVAELVLSRMAELAQRSREVRLSCAPGVLAYADRDQLWEILANYLENAFKYGEAPIDVIVEEGDDWVELRVCDAGAGVPLEFVPQLFERFSRHQDAHLRAEGTGLGLSIAQTLARANGGKAWYEPHEPGGACFGVRVPRVAPGVRGAPRSGG
jgi:signal transduction histidine kinase